MSGLTWLEIAFEWYGPVVCAGLFSVLLWVTWTGKDVWPLTCYPMFSNTLEDGDLQVLRIALEKKDGAMEWWQPPFPRMVRRFYRLFWRIQSPLDPYLDRVELLSPEQEELFRLIASGLSDEETEDLHAIVIVHRKCQPGNQGEYSIADRPYLRWIVPMPVEALS